MHNPENITVDIDEQREWIVAQKAARNLSWSGLEKLSGIPAGTLSTFCTGSYQGRRDVIAKRIFQYRQLIESRADREIGLAREPGYFETNTSRRIRGMLTVAHMGRITVAATGPGTGKTITAKEYAASVSNVTLATMRESSGRLNPMVMEVLRALGVQARGGWGAQLSQLVVDKLYNRNALLIIDEANHLEFRALEEIRGWHDVTGVGVMLLGNEELLQRIEGGTRRDAFARLNSRIAQRLVQSLPEAADVEAFCDAWELTDPGMRDMLKRIALTPGAGGLRECRQIVEQGSMLAADDERPLSFADLRDAQAIRVTRNIL